jgi:PPOX class probable F420-dependent enzyme
MNPGMGEQLSDPRIQRYLATKDIVILGTIDADGAPLITPMWFVHDGEAITMVTMAGSRKAGNLLRDRRVVVVAESGDRVGICRVTIKGRAAIVSDAAEQARHADSLLKKYEPYVAEKWNGRRMPHDRVMFRIVPRSVTSAGLPTDKETTA